MGLADRLHEIMERDYGIKTDKDLLKAIEELPEIDFGIFVSTTLEGLSHAV